ncbi:MAG: DNA-directed RNA polymerase subunit beta' [Ardenticatenaceae bacterium]|nr:DNA-directed RNA polymerase subunit beta' [Ardenticatenaceae bacterium]
MEKTDFRSLRISLASPDHIRSWSYGEVTKPETINYRRLRPEKDGLFCEAIFGPTRDWQCYCGKYKNIRYRGIVCDKCGVEVTRSSVRRERLGHIELAAPVAHVWYTRRVPSYLGLLLNISRRNLDRVLYFAQYVVISVDDDARQRALARLQEELEEAESRIDEETQLKIDQENQELNQKLTELETEMTSLKETFDERLAAATDEAVQEAKAIERRLENGKGEKAEEEIVLNEVVVVKEGDTIGKEHLIVIKDITTERLNQIQEDNEAERQAHGADLEREISQLREEGTGVALRYRDQMGGDLERLRQQAQLTKDQLDSLIQGQFLNETEYREYKSKFGNVFKAGMGAEAFFDILKTMDLESLSRDLWREVRTSRSKQAAKRATRRLMVVESLRKSGNRPEWMILSVLPVIPPDLRPMVQLDGGRFATSDLNDLYRRVINRNNRLKRLLELGAPDVIIRNEKRMLQEAVDSLIDNSHRGKALSRRGRRELKSLSDMLKGKKGRFRRNLLGKRVDYSGRSVIVVGPKLRMGECGLPKVMALELFRPFVISKLIHYGYASNVKGAKRVIERQPPEVWEVLEEVIQGRPILLNRAPTLHRLGIQAFMPKLVEGKAIQLHPLVCSAFNADFDGDQMAVHVPLSEKAVKEAKELMLATNNLLKPSDGATIVGPSKDMVLGVYYLTQMFDGRRGEGRMFGSLDEVEMALQLNMVDIHAKIKLQTSTYFDEDGKRYADNRARRRVIETSPGRVIFNRALPREFRFTNDSLAKGPVNSLLDRIYRRLGDKVTVKTADRIKDIGFKYATVSGTTMALFDLTVPELRAEILNSARNRVEQIDRQYRRGLLTEDEQYQRTIEQWNDAKDQVEKAVRDVMDKQGPIAMMALSGSTKGGFGPITQLAGMRGLMADPQGKIIPVPITSNFRQGLTALEYFISTHGSRKGLADTALRTADAGYLTRRLVDVAQDLIISDEDCGTERGIVIRRVDNFGKQTLADRVYGRVVRDDIYHPETGEILIENDDMITDELATLLDEAGADNIPVRSTMTCELHQGVCAKCYGLDLAVGRPIQLGTAVGIIAAQSIGEPGTQLTLRTFHTGGTAQASGDITQGLPRVEELFEARQKPKGEAVITEIDGTVEVRVVDGVRHVFITNSKLVDDMYELPEGWTLKVGDDSTVDVGDILAETEDEVITARHAGRVALEKEAIKVTWESREEHDYEIAAGMRLVVGDGDTVSAGDQVTEGSKNPHSILEIQGRDAVTNYLLREVQNVYQPQGQTINDKHFELIIRKMLSRVQVLTPGDTELLPGQLIDSRIFGEINDEVVEEGGQPATAKTVLLGISKASLETDSFLSASSFQHTIKVLAGAAIAGKEDDLVGLKENVIIGKLIPAGTGYNIYEEVEEEEEEIEEIDLDNLDPTKVLIDDNTDPAILDALAQAAAEAKAKREQEVVMPEDEMASGGSD